MTSIWNWCLSAYEDKKQIGKAPPDKLLMIADSQDMKSLNSAEYLRRSCAGLWLVKEHYPADRRKIRPDSGVVIVKEK